MAGRRCAGCGSVLHGDVMWCLRCHEPILRYAPRQRLEPISTPLEPFDPAAVRPDFRLREQTTAVYSRVRGGPTTFGLWGRVTTTGIVLLLAPWGPFTALTLFYLLGYLPFAGLVLVVTWRREAIGPAEAAHLDLDARTIDRIRAISAALGASLVAVAIGGHFAFTGYLPAAPFLVVALLPAAARVAAEALEEARRRPVGTLILLNVLNLLDAIMSDAAIGAGVARELNPLVMAVGAPAKLALVAVLSGLVYWKRPRALTVPAVVFVALIAYHLTGLLGALAVGQG